MGGGPNDTLAPPLLAHGGGGPWPSGPPPPYVRLFFYFYFILLKGHLTQRGAPMFMYFHAYIINIYMYIFSILLRVTHRAGGLQD